MRLISEQALFVDLGFRNIEAYFVISPSLEWDRTTFWGFEKKGVAPNNLMGVLKRKGGTEQPYGVFDHHLGLVFTTFHR